MERARLGLIGQGMIGASHARTLAKVEGCDLIACADTEEAKRETADGLGIPFYLRFEEMLQRERLDGVIVAVPNHLHAPIGVACAGSGLHLFVEKPLAQSIPEADRLIEAAARHGVKILVGHQRRFSSLVESARGIVRGGELGKLVGVTATWALLKPAPYFAGSGSWRAERDTGGPILINLIHEVDTLRYICGEIEEVYALASNQVRGFDVEDTACVAMRYESGALGTMFLSDCTPSLTSWEGTTGENPLMHHRPGSCYEFFGVDASLRFPEMKKRFYADPARSGWEFPMAERISVLAPEDPYVREFSHFRDVILKGEDPRISGEDGRRTLEVTLAIKESGKTGMPIRLRSGGSVV